MADSEVLEELTEDEEEELNGTIGKLVNKIFKFIDKLVGGELNSIKNISKKFKNQLSSRRPPLKKIEEKKFEELFEYIDKYVNIESEKNDVKSIKEMSDCEEALKKIKEYLKSIKNELAAIIHPLDVELDKFKRRSVIFKLLEDLMNLDLLSMIRDFLEAVIMFFAGYIIDILDEVYQYYRAVKVMVGKYTVKLSAWADNQIPFTCNYKSDVSKCPVLKKLKLSSCPILEIIPKLSDLVDLMVNTIDTATMPVDEALQAANAIIDYPIVRDICPRTYYPVKLRDVLDVIEELSETKSNVKTTLLMNPSGDPPGSSSATDSVANDEGFISQVQSLVKKEKANFVSKSDGSVHITDGTNAETDINPGGYKSTSYNKDGVSSLFPNSTGSAIQTNIDNISNSFNKLKESAIKVN